jgi:hypothetical protein
MINQLSEALFSNKKGSTHNNNGRDVHSRTTKEEMDQGRQVFSSKMAQLKFPRFSGDEPTECFNHVDQFFEFQGTTDA